MSLTPVLSFSQVFTGPASPVLGAGFFPPDLTSSALYVQVVAGTPVAQFVWDVPTQMWIQLPATAANWSRLESFGWYGRHNDTRRQARPAHTVIDQQCVLIPTFSAHGASTSVLPFEIMDMLTGITLATGSFPPGLLYADAATTLLMDSAGAAITTLVVASGQMLELACVPAGGHALAPADGYGFQVSACAVY